jgi:DNA-binding response OmpR family regulator
MTDASEVLPGRRVLIVEDEMLLAMELEIMVTEQGCAVVGPAPTIDRALALIRSERPDAAILDVNLNGTTAAPIAAELRAQNVPFVLATGYGDKQELQLELRNAPRVKKPISHSRLISVLADVLAERPRA